MIFDNEQLSFQLFDVLYMDQENVVSDNRDRGFDALSFRLESETVVECHNRSIDFFDNCIGFFPSKVNYVRRAKKDKMIVANFKLLNCHGSEIEKFVPENPLLYRSLFEKLLYCWQSKDTAYQYKAAAILNSIFAELYKDNKKNLSPGSKIQKSVDYIEKNFLNPLISLEEAAAKSFVSPTYFRRLFYQRFAMSPKQYIIMRRLNYAASLILTGYYSLQEISELCGYADYKHFSSEFKKTHGVSPSKYPNKRP